ncbi:MAG: hypothetical protein ACT4OZ_00075 [Gemmatimonadota bacterium]
MRFAQVLAVPAVIGALACSGSGDKVANDLEQDLAASSTRIELAGQDASQRMRFVSELEQTQAAEPVQRVRSPRQVATETAGVEQNNTTVVSTESTAELQVAETPSPSPVNAEPEPEASAVPSVAPRPVALPVDVPSEGFGAYGRGGTGRGAGGDGGGIGVGDVIGVVIRGGGVGPDHCPPRGRRPRGRGFPINPILQVVPR